MINKLLMLAVTTGLAAKALRMWIDRETTRKARSPRETVDVQRWEDEGGNLPPTDADASAHTAGKRTHAADSAEKARTAARRPRRASTHPSNA